MTFKMEVFIIIVSFYQSLFFSVLYQRYTVDLKWTSHFFCLFSFKLSAIYKRSSLQNAQRKKPNQKEIPNSPEMYSLYI